MKKRTTRRLFIVPGVILIGIVIMAALIMGRRVPEQVDNTPQGALVNVIIAEKTDRQVTITGHGNVHALHQIALTPQVGGQVVWVHPDFLAGGSFAEGDELVRIESTDYELGVQQSEAMVAQARYQLEVTEANAEIARTEWELIKGDQNSDGEPSSLVLFEPQLRQSQANLQSAEAALAKAELSLSRTVLRAPFNCKVASENVSPGQQIGPQSIVGQLYSTDIAEIEISLQPSELDYIDIPGASVNIVLKNGNGNHTFAGYVHREIGVIGERGRLARVVVRVDDPFKGDAALSLGSFVEAQISGTSANDVFVVPRSALHQDNTIWIAKDNQLSIRPVEVFYKTSNEVLITAGIESGDMIVLTPLSGAANGMKLRPTLPEAGQ